uniref:[histone H3]-dimethyl-L-lysine(36) demethylase n=1 Tax=Sphaeramia orbicularis TaxID=375764 RepID=A0A673BEC0_9TELE
FCLFEFYFSFSSQRAGTRRRYHDDGISDEEIDGRRMFDLEEKVHSQRFNSDRVIRMEGKDFTYEFVQRGGLRDPIIFDKPAGLGIKMPDSDFSVNDVKLFVGSRRMIDVMDVSTQKGTEMSMAQWTRYYDTPPSQREKLYNVISLEFSHTKLENLVKRPTTVDQIDWVDNMWPRHLKERQRDSTNSINDMQYPKVQKYCLMSVEGCYTDFHIDFGGTSVWYHILRGSKVFWLIPPTPQNLELYENWVLSGKQGDVFLGDRASDCQRIELKQGFTFIIPSGWIHAVYTPVDSMVFGGNFLHSFNISTQLNICNIEDRTRVPVKFRYPFYYEMCWYVLERYIFSLTKTSYLTPEFQKYSLGIGLKKPPNVDPSSEQVKEGSSSDEDTEQQSDKPGAKVHLTPFELEGLWNLLGKLETLPSNKKCVPAGIHNAPALTTHIRALLKEHANDNPKLSYTGKPIVKWPKRPSWYQPPPPPPPPPRPKLATTPIIPRPQKPASSMSVLRRRRVRCKRCEACMRPECGDCNFCRDMKKFGGPGKLKQTCVLRQCLSPGLPLSAVCEICKDPNQEDSGDPSLTLMECSNCAQIVHPACLTVQGEGVVNKDLPSCWECPKCVQGITDQEVPSQRRKMTLQARAGNNQTRRGFGANRRGNLVRGGSSHRGSRGGMMTAGSSSMLKLKRGAGMREGGKRGRGVRLRGGSRVQRRGDDSEESDEDDDDDDDEEEEDEEDSEEGDKERRHRQRRRRRRTDDDDDDDEDEDSEEQDFDPEEEEMDTLEDEEEEEEEMEEEGRWDSDPEPPVLLVSDLNDELPRLRGNQGERDARDRSGSSSEEDEAATAALSTLSPPSLLLLPSFKDVGNEKGGEKEVWVSVFKYLNRPELLACMTVCKAWYKWSCDKRLWSHMDVSRCSPLSNQALAGIVKRQPTSLDLSWTPLAKRQLNCLLTRLPGLRELSIAGMSWACLSALVSPTLPYLRLLDLRWCEGVKDSQIKEIITPPGSESSRSRLRNMIELRLSGLDISDSTLRLLQRHMPQLERLDLAHCKDVTDSSIALLAAAGTHTRNNLTELTLAGCSDLTDGCLSYLKRLSSLALLDLRGCKNISRRACDAFISDLSHVALYCMMEEKLIQRLD